jgi:hypothetical protein
MTTSTRRCVWLCAVLMILVAPVAFVTWPTILGTDADAPRWWVADLSAADIDNASRSIEEYPIAYRRAIMKALSPEKRSVAWRNYIKKYLNSHPALSLEAMGSLRDVSDRFTPEFFAARPSATALADLESVAKRVREHVGMAAAREVLVNLGPEDGQTVSLNRPSVVAFLRSRLIANAQAPLCNCSLESDWCGEPGWCQGIPPPAGCIVDDEWPMCGSGWWHICDGICYGN